MEKQAEAEVVPSSSSVEVEIEVALPSCMSVPVSFSKGFFDFMNRPIGQNWDFFCRVNVLRHLTQ